MFDIIFRLILNTVRKIAIVKASCLTLSSTLLFVELPDLRRPVHWSSHSCVELAKSEISFAKTIVIHNIHSNSNSSQQPIKKNMVLKKKCFLNIVLQSTSSNSISNTVCLDTATQRSS